MTEEIYDSTNYQVYELMRFANRIGYEWDGRRFYKVSSMGKTRFVSRVDMIEAYNSMMSRGNALYSIHTTSMYKFAVWERSLGKIYLQWNKKEGKFIAQQHLVKFRHYNLEQVQVKLLLEGNKYEF